ncbi:MAG: response regulator [Bacteroidales bacterium]|nr:response regulator [Bacteroidales bacterium]MBN2820159.1 response regulator [Bacteroidales bacterium]
MRINKKQTIKGLETRIRELESEISKLKSEEQDDKSVSGNIPKSILLSLFSKYEEIDFLIYNIQNGRFESIDDESQSCIFNRPIYEIQNPEEIILPDDLLIFQNCITKLQEQPSIKCQARVLLNNDAKEVKPTEITLTNIPGKDKKALIAIKDISVQTKQQKELLKTKEKIEESDKLKTTILSNISHYIRTPLNSVTGFAELLAASDSDSIKRREFIDIIKRQSKRILGLIDDLSEVAKLESGNINISKTPCNLNLVLNELILGINQQRTISQQELVEIRLNVPKPNGVETLTDSGRLQQTINNIVTYSLRYTQKGHIEIGYRFDEPLQKIIFFVKDTSPGLSKDEQKVIFNKFITLDNTDITKYEDPGLGLTIARNIVKNLGGRIWVESDEGNGTSFFFTIPFEAIDKEEQKISDEEITFGTSYIWPNKVILIVDDEEVNAMFLDAVFQGTSVQLLFAKNGFEAIDLCKSINKIDLILMDIKMPGLNGIKATSEIRKFNTKIPIIAQTALASEENKVESLKAGCNDIITKPIEVQELLITVNKFLSE